jgi:RNA polymerase-binding transcription factor DksA
MSSHKVNRYSDEDLAEFRVLIEGKLAQAREELNFMREQIVELNENSSDQQGGDWFDDSNIHTELEMLNGQVIRQQQFVQNLQNALIRVQNKTYGICSVSGELIEKKRLIAVPHATKSVAAKEEKEKAAPVQATSLMDKKEEMEIKKAAAAAAAAATDGKPKVITRVIRKNPTKASTKAKVDDDDDFDWAFDDDLSGSGNDDDYDLNVNFEDIADESDDMD